MDSEPENGLAWTEESGSAAEEKVHAWMPMEDIEIGQPGRSGFTLHI